VLSLLPEELAKTLESSIRESRPDNDAIKAAVAQNELVPGAEVRRGRTCGWPKKQSSSVPEGRQLSK
jgi:hypothetical protein